MRWILASLALLGCSRHAAIDFAMGSAYRPNDRPTVTLGTTSMQVLAGDLHCHVAPPDDPSDVTRGLHRTADLAREESIDFVVLTPHVWSRFFLDGKLRDVVADGQRELRAAIAVEEKRTGVVFVPGMEYTDHQYGHVGVSFGDLDATLADVPLGSDLSAHPEKFFERWVAHGGLLVIHHPFVTPIASSPIAMGKADLSWRPFTTEGVFPGEIDAVTRLAQGFEAYNLTATHLRDRYLLQDGEVTIRATLNQLDREVRAQGRRIAAVGGSDSHEDHLRAATFVFAKSRTASAIREAIVAGRTCVRDGAACTFVARKPGGAIAHVGDAIQDAETLEVAAQADDVEVFLDGASVATITGERFAKVKVPSRCAVLRARVGKGWSSPIYVNCALG
ncbi:MAG: CehA/McbA family metallohydrolase [Polyangiales bacterium]